ncbi:pyruvate decarboxylase [Fusarium longipes]|uniref:Pyruvate decarboxylase n=1 Tax=Fusarium longipes TaxID=694270 RepID=A0A395T2L6_9HYPO|nr:pyruvate decarboxylase [Fusarium longipes]
MSPFTVGNYLAERLVQIGVRHHFIVPGDYNLILLDKLEAHPSLTEVGCTNELNCSLAAEGYSRGNGVGVCIVTFSVGAFSAFNGIGSAYAEDLPLIVVSGAPNTNDAGQRLLHHTLGEYDTSYQLAMVRSITCYAESIRHAAQAPQIIDRAIREALTRRKPVYIEIPTNLAGETCMRPGPIGSITQRLVSDEHALNNAVSKVSEYLDGKQKCIILVGPKVPRVRAQQALLQLAEAIGCAVVLQPAAKGSFPEDHPQFAGIFWGQVSTLGADTIANWADVMLCIGTVFTDYSTVGWTALPSVPQIIIDVHSVSLATHFYTSGIQLSEFLIRLADIVCWNDNTMVEYNRLRPDIPIAQPSPGPERLTRKEISRQTQLLLDSNTTIFADTGDSWFNGLQLNLPCGAGFEIEMQWGHIGWSIPASFGYALARPNQQIIVLVGDGAFQMTGQEVSQMVRLRVPIIMLLMNNKGYTIEVEIHDGLYNRIQDWDYARFVEAFNSQDGQGKALGLQARTSEELSESLKGALGHKTGPTLIDCSLHRDDCSRELITWGHFVAAANSRAVRKEGWL